MSNALQKKLVADTSNTVAVTNKDQGVTDQDIADEVKFTNLMQPDLIKPDLIQPGPIQTDLENMLVKLPEYADNKKEEQYKTEYIEKNKDGDLFTDEEEKDETSHSVGGRTQKKKKKRVQNRRRQKTIKNKV